MLIKDITKKELLIFSNLTKLDWQFSNLKKIRKKDKNGNEIEVYKNISALLSPQNFIREITDEKTGRKILKWIYIPNADNKSVEELTEKDISLGYENMRKFAPLAMECIENINIKCPELNNWEVLDGGDQYKIVTEFIDDLNDSLSKITGQQKAEAPYPTREQVEKNIKKRAQIKYALMAIDIAANIIPIGINLKFANEMAEEATESAIKLFTKSIYSESKKNILKLVPLGNEVDGLISTVAKGGTKNWALYTVSTTSSITSSALNFKDNEIEKANEKELTNEQVEAIKSGKNKKEISLIRNFNLANTEFRYVVLRNKQTNEIIISYKGSKNSEKEMLPDEIDALQLLYSKISFQNKDSKINFIGLDEGGDLSNLSALMFSEKSTSFYTKEINFKNYIEFTPDDIDKNYKNNNEIFEIVTTDIQLGYENMRKFA
jgi:hypothetical protein